VGARDGIAGGSAAAAVDDTGVTSASIAIGEASSGAGDAISGILVIATRAVVGSTVSVGEGGIGTVTVGGIGDGTLEGTRAQPAATTASNKIAASRRPADTIPLFEAQVLTRSLLYSFVRREASGAL
jgi:hypothetical protein